MATSTPPLPTGTSTGYHPSMEFPCPIIEESLPAEPPKLICPMVLRTWFENTKKVLAVTPKEF